MTAIKKTIAKTAKSPAPATKVAVAAPAKSAKATSKKTTAPVASGNGTSHAATAAAVTAPAPKPAAAAKPVAAPKPVAATKTATTTIQARIDVGFGNTLYIRGEGPGLSWDKGVLMDCVGQDQWQIGLGESARPFAVKFLVNDITWSTGPDYIVPSGVNVTFAPQF